MREKPLQLFHRISELTARSLCWETVVVLFFFLEMERECLVTSLSVLMGKWRYPSVRT